MKWKWIILSFVAGTSILGSLWLGAFDIDPFIVLRSSFNHAEWFVFKEIRLPRVGAGFIAGSVLAACGAWLQGLFRNPLADPGIIGVSSGAAAFAVLAILFSEFIIDNGFIANVLILPISAFIGAAFVVFSIHMIAVRKGETSLSLLLLAGIAFQFIGGAVIGLCLFLSTEEQLRSINFWMMGSLGQIKWMQFFLFLLSLLPLLAYAPKINKELNALAFGESHAKSLGVNVKRTKHIIILFTTLAVGISVAFCGIIGFIGLVAPHLSRLMFGENHKVSFPASILIGGTLVVLADTAARSFFPPQEVPLGILTSIIGAPVLLSLIFKQRHKLLRND